MVVELSDFTTIVTRPSRAAPSVQLICAAARAAGCTLDPPFSVSLVNLGRFDMHRASGSRMTHAARSAAACCGSALALAVLAVAATSSLGSSTPRSAPSTTSPVVPPAGTVAGRGYAQWQTAYWKYAFKLTAADRFRVGCKTVDNMLMTFAGPRSKKPKQLACSVPAGQAVYVNGPIAVDCSTFEAPPFHGSTPAQLKRCAKREYKTATVSKLTLDGNAIDPAKYATATGVFAIKKPSGRAAAYGEGLLLSALSPGTHVLHQVARAPGFRKDVTYTFLIAPPAPT